MANISELEKCPNCGTKLKGLFATGSPVSESKIDFLNSRTSEKKEAYCTNCYDKKARTLVDEYSAKKKEITDKIQDLIDFMPIITCVAPDKWDCEVLNMVETQTTAGTGFLTDLSRGINDLFGTTSNSSNAKIEKATNRCKRSIKYNALKIGGNAVISVDIDYSEVGSGSSNMLMVCMAGTAVRINNLEIFPSDLKSKMATLSELSKELSYIQRDLNYLAN